MANKTVIAESDNVTAKQLKELANQIDLKIVTGTLLGNFLDNAKLYSLKPPRFGKQDIPKLIDLVWGDTKRDFMSKEAYVLPVEWFKQWKSLLMFAVAQFRVWVESWNRQNHAAHIEYYRECFDRIDAAKDDEQLSKAIGYLALSIQTD